MNRYFDCNKIDDIVSRIDYSNIQDYEVSDSNCENLVLKSKVYGFNTIVVGPSSLPIVEKIIEDSNIKIAVSIAYPSGAYLLDSKIEEIKDILEDDMRVDEFYIVMAVGRFLSGYVDEAREEINAFAKATGNKTVKLVIEASVMNKTQKKTICDMAAQAGVKYIVASTGFAAYDVPFPTGDDIADLVQAAAGRVKIIACGAIDTLEDACNMLNAGCERICTTKADILYKR